MKKTSVFDRASALVVAAFLASAIHAAPPPTGFTYQGSMTDGGVPMTGQRTTGFKLFDAPTGGVQIGGTIVRTTDFDNGLFTETLDFGTGPFEQGVALWLEVIVSGQQLDRTLLKAAPYSLSTRGISVDAAGNVGLGTTTPGSLLHLSKPGTAQTSVRYTNLSGEWLAGVNSGGNGTDGSQFFVYDAASVRYAMTFQKGTGYVGVGKTTPAAALDVDGGGLFSGSLGVGTTNPAAQLDVQGTAMISDWLSIGNGTNAAATALDVNGVVTIRGGADLVEGFDAVCELADEPGTVVVIDPDNPGMLMCSSTAYDMKVAGVVSGANGISPGIRLGQDGTLDGDIPVAMTGRVYVKASAENGPIAPGDLLTTASIPGHAMKVTDHARGQGAVIGKAMTPLAEGRGMVLVLVNLQ